MTAKEAFAARQDHNGIDLGHLRSNLKLTPTERAQKHASALRLLQTLLNAADASGIRKASLPDR